MAVNEALNALSTTAASNTPAGTDSVGTDLDDHIRDIKKNIKYSATWPVQAAKITTYNMVATDLHQWVTADTSGGAFSINLLAAATAGDGFAVGVKLLVAGNTLTLDGNASETIDGVTTYTMDSQYEAVILVCDGSNWHIMAGGPVEGDNVDITNTTALTALADADEVLVYDATATANRKITAANFSQGMDWVLLGAATASADEYITFAEVFTSAYHAYKISLSGVQATLDNKQISFQLGTGSTPTWIAGTNNNVMTAYSSTSGPATFGGGSATGLAWAPASGTWSTGTATDVEKANSELIISGCYNSANNGYTYVRGDHWGTDHNPYVYWGRSVLYITNGGVDITSIRFTAVSAHVHTAETIAQGEFRVYGLRNA